MTAKAAKGLGTAIVVASRKNSARQDTGENC